MLECFAQEFLPSITLILVAPLLGIIIMYWLYQLVILVLMRMGNVLYENKHGIIGFWFFFLGFSLQFLATFFQNQIVSPEFPKLPV